jgi:RNA polymerase sigma factor (sigma-70 family)
VGRVAGYVARRAASADVADVVAETFLTAWRRFDELPADPVPWLFVTARRLVANRVRSARRRRALHERVAASSAFVPLVPETELAEVDQRLLTAIRELPDAEREAFILVAWDDLDPARAARVAGCSPGTFRMRLHRARRRLKQRMALRPFPDLTASRAPVEEPR